MKKIAYALAATVLAATLLLSCHHLWQYHATERENGKRFGALAKQVKTSPPTLGQPDGAPPTQWTVDDQYGKLFRQNPDMVGWIKIDGTPIDYPVMQTPDRPDFYLNHDFKGRYSRYGVPYAFGECGTDPQSDNVTIFGHHMRSGAMFGSLEGYKDEAFYRKHPLVHFDTCAGFGTYEVIAAFKTHPADFPYNLFVIAADGAEFDEHIRRCMALSLYDTGKSARYGDKLISLSTCEYSRQNNRLVVVARKIEGGGATDGQNQDPPKG